MRFKPSKAGPPEVDMTPMIDIVFQLIAFFMVITNFEQTQADERVKLAKDQLAIPPAVKRENELVIQIGFLRDENARKLDPQPFVFYAGEDLRIEAMEAKLRLEKQIYQDQEKNIKDITLVIRADAEVPVGVVQELIRMAQDTNIGFEKFAIKAIQKQDQK